MPLPYILQQLVGGLIAGCGGGLMAGLFGAGGGMLLIPLLGLTLGIDQHQAQGMSLAAMLLPTGLPAVRQYRRAGVALHTQLLPWMMGAFALGVGAGALVATSSPLPWMRRLFALFLLTQVVLLVRRSGSKAAPAARPVNHQVMASVLIGMFGGFASGLLGIGGAVVMLPLLVGWFALSQLEAQLTTLVIMLPPLGLPAVWIYAHSHPLPWYALGGAVLGLALGSHLGAKTATKLPATTLQWSLAALLLVVVARTLLQ